MIPTPAVPPQARVRSEVRIPCAGQAPVVVHIRGPQRPRPGTPVVLYFHGGAFTCRPCASAFADALVDAGASLLTIDYPLAPAQPFPHAVEAGYAVLAWAQAQRAELGGSRSALLVAGEEAGGTIAAAVALMARDRLAPRLAGTILLSPMLDPSIGTASLRRCRAGPVGCKWADGWARYLSNPGDADHPYAVPALASRQSGLPPTLLLSAEDDPLRDETASYAARLRASRVEVETVVLPAPTGWPESLWQADADAPWRAALRRQLQDFLAARPAPA